MTEMVILTFSRLNALIYYQMPFNFAKVYIKYTFSLHRKSFGNIAFDIVPCKFNKLFGMSTMSKSKNNVFLCRQNHPSLPSRSRAVTDIVRAPSTGKSYTVFLFIFL